MARRRRPGRRLGQKRSVSWAENKNIAWKTEIPGRGWSSPVVDGTKVWLTTAVDKPATKDEQAAVRKTTTNSQPLTISSFVS